MTASGKDGRGAPSIVHEEKESEETVEESFSRKEPGFCVRDLTSIDRKSSRRKGNWIIANREIPE